MRRNQKQRISGSIDLQQWATAIKLAGQDWISHIFPRSMIEIEKMASETFFVFKQWMPSQGKMILKEVIPKLAEYFNS